MAPMMNTKGKGKGQGQRAKGKGQRAKGKEQRAKSKGQRAKHLQGTGGQLFLHHHFSRNDEMRLLLHDLSRFPREN